MVHRVVRVLDALGDVPGELDVDALIVVDGSSAEVPEAEACGQRDQRYREPNVPIAANEGPNVPSGELTVAEVVA